MKKKIDKNKLFKEYALTYKKLVKRLNNEPYLKKRKIIVVARYIKDLITKRILPKPKGLGRWKHFDDLDYKEIINFYKLKVEYKQNLKSIKEIQLIISCTSHYSNYGLPEFKEPPFPLTVFVSVLERFAKDDKDWHKKDEKGKKEKVGEIINDFKSHKLVFVYDPHFYSYCLTSKEKIPSTYVRVKGKVFKLLPPPDSIGTLDNPKKVTQEYKGYFSEDQLHSFLALCNGKNIFPEYNDGPYGFLNRSTVDKKIKKIKSLIKSGALPPGYYKYKNKNLYDGGILYHALLIAQELIKKFHLNNMELKLIRGRIEKEIQDYFFTPDKSFFSNTLFSEFQKQHSFYYESFECLFLRLLDLEDLDDINEDDRSEKSNELIKNYINGFYFLCRGTDDKILLKKKSIDMLTPQQLKLGISKSMFTKNQVEKLTKSKEVELKILKKIIKPGKGGK